MLNPIIGILPGLFDPDKRRIAVDQLSMPCWSIPMGSGPSGCRVESGPGEADFPFSASSRPTHS